MNAPVERRFKLTLQYDGSGFLGWQVQPGGETVQGALESALERLTGSRVPALGSGRTDRGVHATGQVASILLSDRWNAPELHRALNALLPASIWVLEVRRVPLAFHPRYDAVDRTYHYLLGTDPMARSPFLKDLCWPVQPPVDRALLEACAGQLPGDRSFRRFAKAGQEERGDRCTVFEASWDLWGGLGLVFRITANRYLHHMVRYLVGTMVEIGRGKRSPSDFSALLADGEAPVETSPPAPPQGLYLAHVRYPETSDQTIEGDRFGIVPETRIPWSPGL